MTALFQSGLVVDLILVAVVVETVALLGYRSRTGRGIAPADLLFNVLAGAFLLVALRTALVGSSWSATAAWLAAALIAHVADLSRRWGG